METRKEKIDSLNLFLFCHFNTDGIAVLISNVGYAHTLSSEYGLPVGTIKKILMQAALKKHAIEIEDM
ncbi:MAG: hypothetical protein ACR2PH_11760 [Desulfobulbia bacterium]